MISQGLKKFWTRNLTKRIENSLLSATKRSGNDLIFIRHAQSQFNVACQQYRIAHKIPYVWKELCNHEGFNQKVLFNLKYVDCNITSKGRMDCIKKRNLLKNQKIDCVLVSPQIRALQTCDYLFGDRRIPIIVDPLLVGPLRSCCDINKPTQYKKLIYPNFNFAPTKEYHELWYLDYLPAEQQKICYARFQEKGLKTTDEMRAQLVELLREGKVYEDAIQYRKRINQVKQRILYYKNAFPRIAVVSHYYTIEYISAVEYMKCGTPKYYIDVQNCTPYYASLPDLLNRPKSKHSPKESIKPQIFTDHTNYQTTQQTRSN